MNRIFLFSLIWFPLGLLPVILLPLHKSTHYLEISLPSFWILIGYIVLKFYNQVENKNLAKIFISILIISLIILSTTSTLLGSINYWAASRGKIARQLIEEIKISYPVLPKGSIIYFKDDPSYPFLNKDWGKTSKQASIILNGSDALQLLYNDPTIKVFYEDLGGLPKEISSNIIYMIIAKIN